MNMLLKKKKKFLIGSAIIFGLIYGFLNIFLNLNIFNLRSLRAEKSKEDLKEYACLFRDGKVSKDRFCELIDDENFENYVQKASKAFGVPYPVLFCTSLIESGLDHRAKSGPNAGYGQFSGITVDQLNNLTDMKLKDYKSMWERYTDKNVDEITRKNVMKSKNPEIPIGAIAMYSRWIFDRIDKLDCSGCGPEGFLTDKKIALMIASYNWSPFKIKKMADLNLWEMVDPDESPMPKISMNYIKSMNYCRNAGQFDKLRTKETVQNKRINQCKSICG